MYAASGDGLTSGEGTVSWCNPKGRKGAPGPFWYPRAKEASRIDMLVADPSGTGGAGSVPERPGASDRSRSRSVARANTPFSRREPIIIDVAQGVVLSA